jgi:hypothetical protein
MPGFFLASPLAARHARGALISRLDEDAQPESPAPQ